MSKNTITSPSEIDFSVQNGGSIFILRAHSEAAEDWIADNVHQNEETQHFGGGIILEGRYVRPIIEGLREAGLDGSIF